MDRTRNTLVVLGLPSGDPHELPTSPRRFPDGAQYRVEIPSVEGPDAFEEVLQASRERGVRVHRVSQGSGIMLQTDDEIERMVRLGHEHDVEVCLFVGPRALWDIGAQAASEAGRVVGSSLRGSEQLVYGVEDVRRACELGLRGVLVSDLGQLWVLAKMKEQGDLPADLGIKTSIALPAANPATARILEELGATSVNVPVDLTLAQIAGVRQAVSIPLDMYVESSDEFGGAVRHYELPELVRVASPVHLKFGLRNAAPLYPAGEQLRALVLATARERVRRAAIGLSMLKRYYPEAIGSP